MGAEVLGSGIIWDLECMADGGNWQLTERSNPPHPYPMRAAAYCRISLCYYRTAAAARIRNPGGLGPGPPPPAPTNRLAAHYCIIPIPTHSQDAYPAHSHAFPRIPTHSHALPRIPTHSQKHTHSPIKSDPLRASSARAAAGCWTCHALRPKRYQKKTTRFF
jgi:hypothetical protein